MEDFRIPHRNAAEQSSGNYETSTQSVRFRLPQSPLRHPQHPQQRQFLGKSKNFPVLKFQDSSDRFFRSEQGVVDGVWDDQVESQLGFFLKNEEYRFEH